MEEKKLLMLVNPRAGRSRSRSPLYDAAAVFSAQGYLLSIHNTAAPGEARSILLERGEDFDVVAAIGGDGTLNEAVSALMELHRPPLLAYLPRGSTNDFAASLHLSPDPAKAAEQAVSAVPRRLDVGQWNERYFVYVASFGAFVRSSYAAPQAAKNALGHFAYFLEGVRDLDSLRPYPVRITADGETLNGEYLFGAICNSTSVGGVMKLEDSGVVLDDGLFELLLIPAPRTPAELQNVMLALVNQEYENPSLIFRHVSAIRLEARENLPWSLDGEYAPGTEQVVITNHRRALEMML